MDFNRYAYFASKAKNFAISMRPDRFRIVDGEKIYDSGLRIEFNNGMLRLNKNDELDIAKIEFLRMRLEKEKDMDVKQRTFQEIVEQEKMISESKLVEVLSEKNLEIDSAKAKQNKLEKENEDLKKQIKELSKNK